MLLEGGNGVVSGKYSDNGGSRCFVISALCNNCYNGKGFRQIVEKAGDVNKDGIDDFIIGTSYTPNDYCSNGYY